MKPDSIYQVTDTRLQPINHENHGNQINPINQSSDNVRHEAALKCIESIQRHFKTAILNVLLELKHFNDNKYYADLGYPSLAECMRDTLGIDASVARKYSAIVQRLLTYVPQDNRTEIEDAIYTDLPVEAPVLPTDYQKLYHLSKLKEPQKQRLLAGDRANLRGKWFTLADFNEMSRDQVADTIKRATMRPPRSNATPVYPNLIKVRTDVHVRMLRIEKALNGINELPLDKQMRKDFLAMAGAFKTFADIYFPEK